MNESNLKKKKKRRTLPLTLQYYEHCRYNLFALGILGEIVEEKEMKVCRMLIESRGELQRT